MNRGAAAGFALVVAGTWVAPGCFLLDERSRRTRPDDGGAPSDASTPRDARPGDDAAVPCVPSDRTTWRVETYDAGGWYDRFAAALSGLAWIAINEHEGNVVFLELGVDDSGIVERRRVELPESPVYPLAFDTDGTRFALLATSAQNFNGTPSLWLLDATTGAIAYADFPEISPESAFTYRAMLGLVGPNVVLAAVSAADDVAWIELRGPDLRVIEHIEQPETFGLVGIHEDDAHVAIHTRARTTAGSAYRVDATAITPFRDTSEHAIIGGLDGYYVEYDADFRIRRGERIWSAEWPHTQISPPAVLRTFGDLAAFSLQKELSGTVGYTNGDALEWLDVEVLPGASGVGVAMLPLVEERRLGLFYLGLEIPRPEQPIRYYGIVCE